jgi:hypothetical protein
LLVIIQLYQKHIKAAQICLGSLKPQKIFELAELEQLFATGVDNNGDIQNVPKKKNEIIDTLQNLLKVRSIIVKIFLCVLIHVYFGDFRIPLYLQKIKLVFSVYI